MTTTTGDGWLTLGLLLVAAFVNLAIVGVLARREALAHPKAQRNLNPQVWLCPLASSATLSVLCAIPEAAYTLMTFGAHGRFSPGGPLYLAAMFGVPLLFASSAVFSAFILIETGAGPDCEETSDAYGGVDVAALMSGKPSQDHE